MTTIDPPIDLSSLKDAIEQAMPESVSGAMFFVFTKGGVGMFVYGSDSFKELIATREKMLVLVDNFFPKPN